MKKNKALLFALAMALVSSTIIVIYILLMPISVHHVVRAGWAWCGVFRAWLDENENGIWDTNERPLQDVEFSVTYNQDGSTGSNHSRVESDWKGEAYTWSTVFAECPDMTIEIFANSPHGYRPTTPNHRTTRVINTREYCIQLRDQGTFSFGFTYLPGSPTVTPFPAPPVCTSYTNELRQDVYDIAVAPDNTLWFATLDGVFHFNPSENTWTHYKIEDGLISNHAKSIAVSLDDNIVWFGTDRGVTRFDGSSWKSYTIKDGLVSDQVTAIAIASDDTVWCVTHNGGISRFFPDTDGWITNVIGDRKDNNVASHITAASDGSLWVGTQGEGLFHVVPITDSSEIQISTYKLDPRDTADAELA